MIGRVYYTLLGRLSLSYAILIILLQRGKVRKIYEFAKYLRQPRLFFIPLHIQPMTSWESALWQASNQSGQIVLYGINSEWWTQALVVNTTAFQMMGMTWLFNIVWMSDRIPFILLFSSLSYIKWTSVASPNIGCYNSLLNAYLQSYVQFSCAFH